jgi:7,8-didemethyl-8-hydroxy-5-deazariboflavin synthase CofG subunit
MSAGMASILEKALAGEGLSAPEGYRLLDCRDDEVEQLLRAGGALRDRHKGRIVTYSRKVFLPITNLCRNQCSYCAFRKTPEDPEVWTLTPDDIHDWLRRGRAQSCKEALMCLGDKPERAYPGHRKVLAGFGHKTTTEYVYRACAIALDYGLLPHTNAGVLSRDEMKLLREVNASLGLMLEAVTTRLRRRGMVHYRSPDKDPARRLRMLREAGELQIPFTTGILVGIGETRAERVDSLLAIREIHRDYGHIQEVIIQNFSAKPGTRMAGCPEPGAREMARTVAAARLLLGGEMNIQAPPNLNPKGIELLLRAGINDWGGISPVTKDHINPGNPWPHLEDLAKKCRREGFTLGERLAIYPDYIERPGFLWPALLARTRELQTSMTA